MNKLFIWLKAARIKLHILGILPVLVGSLIAFNKTGSFGFSNFLLAELITLFVLVATAFANDYADVQTDKINRNFNIFSGGSRSIVGGLISKRQMFVATIISSFISIVLSFLFLTFLGGHPIILILNLIGLFVGIEYSLLPLKINYRGFGEFFVMAMYSLFCIFFGYVTQIGFGFDINIIYFSIPIAIAIFLIILITEVPDYESDKAGGKKTIPTVFGKEAAFLIYFLGIVLFYISISILYLIGIISKFVFYGLFFSLPLGVYLGKLSLSGDRILPKNISILCGATIILNVWVGIVLSLNLAIGF